MTGVQTCALPIYTTLTVAYQVCPRIHEIAVGSRLQTAASRVDRNRYALLDEVRRGSSMKTLVDEKAYLVGMPVLDWQPV